VSDAPPTIDESAPAKDAVPAAAFGISAAGTRSQFSDIRRRFLRNKLAVLGLVMVGIVFALAIFAPLLAPSDPRLQELGNTTAKPSGAHWLGTDELGRDQLSRIIYGSRIAIVVGLASIVLALLLGVLLGSIAGYRGCASPTPSSPFRCSSAPSSSSS
jgi:ABC-type dipeptide/oligopeptide/nickel transport system permease subunit